MGSILRETAGSVCSKCYARKGFYVFAAARNAMDRRFSRIELSFWAEACAMFINEKKLPFFRWHDSGDIQNLHHLRKIAKVAELCPDCKFWLPTREASILTEYFDTYGLLPANLIIRVSGSMIDGPAPIGLATKFDLNVSSVTTNKEAVTCYAFSNDGKCGDCRACWDKNTFEVVYLAH